VPKPNAQVIYPQNGAVKCAVEGLEALYEVWAFLSVALANTVEIGERASEEAFWKEVGKVLMWARDSAVLIMGLQDGR
jgi:hypothetical protein